MLLLHVVQWFARLGQLSYRIPAPLEWVTIGLLFSLVGLAASFRIQTAKKKSVQLVLCGALAVATVLVAASPFSPRPSAGKLEISVLDVGQGDSLFIVTPEGKTLLIDGGGAFGGFSGQAQSHGTDPGEEAVSPYLWSRGFKKIDVVALTHAHQDHVGGLNAILENFRVGQLWIGREVDSPALAKLESLARAKQVGIHYEARGDSFPLDGVVGTFLWPEKSAADTAVAAKNNDSLVLRLKFRDEALMLPGDAEKQAEHAMLTENREEDLPAEVLKIGHHGSKNSMTEEFLHAVNPKVAIISAGEDNPYGHPSAELLERLDTAGVRVLRTDRDGAVHIVTNGERLEISCFVACPEPVATNTAASGHPQMPDQDQGQQQ
jgi:competence protein ComEC